MKPKSKIKEVLMKRDRMSSKEAEELIQQAKEELQQLLEADEMEAAYDICETYFGLEPDYIIELLPFPLGRK